MINVEKREIEVYQLDKMVLDTERTESNTEVRKIFPLIIKPLCGSCLPCRPAAQPACHYCQVGRRAGRRTLCPKNVQQYGYCPPMVSKPLIAS